MATIQKRGDSYKITVSAGYDAEGKQIRHTMTYKPEAKEGTRKQEKELQKVALDFEERVKNGEIYSGEKITFNQFMETWEKEWSKNNLTPSQQECYKRLLEKHVCVHIGNMKIADIKTMHCQKIINISVNSGYAVKTTRKMFSSMNSVFKYAKRMQIIKTNPCNDAELPKKKGKKYEDIRAFNIEQSRKFLEALGDTYQKEHGSRTRKDRSGNAYQVKAYTTDFQIPYQFQVFYTIACYSGCRRGELLALTWKDIDFENQIIDINKAIAESKETGIYVKDPKTTSGYRKITLPSICFEMLHKWQEMEINQRIRLSNKWEGEQLNQFENQFIFIQENGKPMDPKTPTHKFKDILELINNKIQKEAELLEDPEAKEKKLSELLPIITLHELRHTASTLLVSQGMDIATISKRLGHSEISTTLNIYTHALPEKDREASDILEKIYSEEKPMIHTETMRVSRDEKEFLERLRNADPELQELITDMLTGNYSKAELYSMARSGKQKRN